MTPQEKEEKAVEEKEANTWNERRHKRDERTKLAGSVIAPPRPWPSDFQVILDGDLLNNEE